MTLIDNSPRLYVVVRTDMASMTPGRIAAQVSHATSQFHEYMHHDDTKNFPIDRSNFRIWKENRDFGTTIVLEANCSLDELLQQSYSMNHSGTGVTIDPEYVLRDGIVTHIIPNVPTCFWIFCLPSDFKENPVFAELKLL